MKAKVNAYTLIYILLALVTAVGAIAWTTATAPYADDFNYSRECTATSAAQEDLFWDLEGSHLTSPSQIWPSMVNHFTSLNSRIPNLLMFPAMMLPRWLTMGIMGLLIAIMLIQLWKAAGSTPRRGSLAVLWAGTALLWLALPWYDNFVSLAYHMNYVPVSILFLLTVGMAAHVDRSGSTGLTVGTLLAFLTGWWHEGFAIPLAAWLGVMTLQADNRRNRRRLLLMAAGACGALVIHLQSGTGARLSSSHISTPLNYIVSHFISELWPVWLAIASLIAVGIFGGFKAMRSQLKLTLPAWAAVAASVGIATSLALHGRVLWLAELVGTLLCLRYTAALVAGVSRPRWALWVSLAAVAAYAWWLAGLAGETARTARQQRAIVAAVEEHAAAADSDNVVFADIDITGIPYRYLGIPDISTLYVDRAPGDALFVPRSRSVDAVIMPAAFRGKPFEDWDTVPGTAGLRGKWPFAMGRMPADGYIDGGETTVLRWVGVMHATKAFTPVNRLLLWSRQRLGAEVHWLKIKCLITPVTYRGHQYAYYQFEPLPRWAALRDVVAVDSVTLNTP